MASGDLRQDVRCIIDTDVDLTAVTPAGDRFFVKAKCKDVSLEGLRILVADELEPQTAVFVRSPELGVHTLGVVRHCRRVVEGYSVGIHLTVALRLPLPAALPVSQRTGTSVTEGLRRKR